MSNSRHSCEVRDETYLKTSQTRGARGRPPDASETAILNRQFQTALKHYHANPKDAASLIRTLDEAITHE